MEALVGLITTVARVNIDKEYRKQLKPLPGLKGVDVDVQEKTSVAKHVEGEHLMVGQLKRKWKERLRTDQRNGGSESQGIPTGLTRQILVLHPILS